MRNRAFDVAPRLRSSFMCLICLFPLMTLIFPGKGKFHLFFLPRFLNLVLAFSAKVARFRVFGFFDFFRRRSVLSGIFCPFLVPVLFLSLPRLDFLILIPDFRRAISFSYLRMKWMNRFPGGMRVIVLPFRYLRTCPLFFFTASSFCADEPALRRAALDF